MTRLINLVKTLNVINRKAFKDLLNEWIKNKTLDDDCIMVLWAWFTKTMIVSDEDRVIATILLSMVARYKLCSFICVTMYYNNITEFRHFSLMSQKLLFINL